MPPKKRIPPADPQPANPKSERQPATTHKPVAAKKPAIATPRAAGKNVAVKVKKVAIEGKPAADGASEAPKPPARRKPGAAKPTTTAAESAAPLSILMVVSEAHPFAKTGGLAEVAGALPDALARLGHRVTLVLPRYRGVDAGDSTSEHLSFHLGDRTQHVVFHTRQVRDGVTAVLVDAPELFDRDGLYNSGGVDFQDNAWRFAVLSRAALDYARMRGDRPSVIHAHDWQTGLLPVYQKTHFPNDPVVGGVPVVFTIHNLAFQGVFPSGSLRVIGLGWDVFTMNALEYWDQISYLKGGINFSERITTVSPSYAREILTPEMGFGLEGTLQRRAADLSGILNGIDVQRWDPGNDEFLPAPYGPHDFSGKTRAKQVLLETVGLPADAGAMARPVIGLVSRLSDQKGFDLIGSAIGPLTALDAAWVMLGSGERHYEANWRFMASVNPARFAATIGFNERLAHLIEAGADIFLMPSRFEPCGLGQMIAMCYGSAPIVRATGGLAETVEEGPPFQPRTGFVFGPYEPGALQDAVLRALDSYSRPAEWRMLMRNGMCADHSWRRSARAYVNLYRQALVLHRGLDLPR